MKLKFCGAARSVTGSCYLLEYDDGNILVDCGMRQGSDKKGEYGEDRFPFDPKFVNSVLLTHAHIDHSGLLPLLVKRGFRGTVLATEATAQLCSIMLPDSAHIQEQEAEWENRKRLRAGKEPVEPLYVIKDVIETLKLFRTASYREILQLLPGVKVRFNDAGHLLGSSSIEIWAEENKEATKLVFSGDIGRAERPIINDPETIQSADYLICEGTYGDRNHEVATDGEKMREFANVLAKAIRRGGNIVIPSFAIGRTQEMLYYIKRLLKANSVPGLEKIPVFVDSPLGISATQIYERCMEGYYDKEALEMAKGGSPFDFPTLKIAQTADESKAINAIDERKIIISSSGMCDAGRIRHHLKHNLFRADATVIFAGYQAAGTLGRMLLDGAKKVKLFGEDVRVNAGIEKLEGFSGHAGKDELLAWIRAISPKPEKVFLVHGEEDVLDSFASSVRSLGYSVLIPKLGEVFDLEHINEAVKAPDTHAAALEERERGFGIRRETERIIKLLESMEDKRSLDVALKLDIMEEDIRTFVEKWEKLLRV
ncbi:MAG: Ribonuclease [Firmicutes bacterium ADurb.Bin182]|nr:MAG: Ribonuclease [Firmicutes bacterium ADurb.Bin182]